MPYTTKKVINFLTGYTYTTNDIYFDMKQPGSSGYNALEIYTGLLIDA
jgi:hypothetical protein